MRQYVEAFDNLTLPSDMTERILGQLEKESDMKTLPIKSTPVRKKKRHIITFAATAACLVLVIGCIYAVYPRESNPVEVNPSSNSVGIINPIQSVESIQDLKDSLPFALAVPANLPEGYELGNASAISGSLAQINYTNHTGTICYRMAEGENDISGDYNAWDTTQTQQFGNIPVTLKGKGDDVHLATWSADGFSYSLSFTEAVAAATVQTIIESISPVE